MTKAVEHWPDLFQLSALYGAVLAKSGEDGAAYHALRRAHQLNLQDKGTEDLLFLTTLGLGRRSQGAKEYPDALRYFEEAAKLRPQEASPHAGMADIFKLTGHAAQAAREQSTAELLKKRTGN